MKCNHAVDGVISRCDHEWGCQDGCRQNPWNLPVAGCYRRSTPPLRIRPPHLPLYSFVPVSYSHPPTPTHLCHRLLSPVHAPTHPCCCATGCYLCTTTQPPTPSTHLGHRLRGHWLLPARPATHLLSLPKPYHCYHCLRVVFTHLGHRLLSATPVLWVVGPAHQQQCGHGYTMPFIQSTWSISRENACRVVAPSCAATAAHWSLPVVQLKGSTPGSTRQGGT
jgi:hypothetical protein